MGDKILATATVSSGGSYTMALIIACIIIVFITVKILKKQKAKKQQQIDQIMIKFQSAEGILSDCIKNPLWAADRAEDALKKLRELNTQLRSLGKDYSPKINQLEQTWQTSYAAEKRRDRDYQCQTLTRYFENQQTSLNKTIAVLLETPNQLAGLSLKEFENNYYDLAGPGTDAASIESTWMNMKSQVISLAKLDPPEDLSGRLFQSAYDGLSALIRYTILTRGTGRGLYTAESFIGQIRSGKDELIALNPTANCNDEVLRCEQLWEQFIAFDSDSMEAANHGMMDLKNYGQVNHDFMAAVPVMTRPEAESVLKQCESAKFESTLDAVAALNPQKLLQALWAFAMEEPLQLKDLSRAQDFCRWYFDNQCPDVKLAEWYTQRQLGGADAIARLDNQEFECLSGQLAETLASGLMWLQGYHQEHAILQKMLEAQYPMSPKAQQRLNALSNGGGKAPNIHGVVSGDNEICFDVSALTWKDEDYTALFDNLVFHDKKLTYSLAVREEDKNLVLPSGVSLPNTDMILAKLKEELQDEYGNQVNVKNAVCIILSGSGQERIHGFITSSSECSHLGIVLHLASIGKKVNIKFYTLFLPDGLDSTAQKQQALSLYKKLSPTVTMWETSLKDTLLTAIQKLLNSSVQGGSTSVAPPLSSDNKPVF